MPELEIEGARPLGERDAFKEERSNTAGEDRNWRLACVGAVAAFIAHRIAQPMTAINALASSSLKAARQPMPDNAKLTQNLEKIEQQAHRATEMIRAIAQFAHRADAEAGPAEFHAVVAKLAPLEREAERHGIVLRVNAAPGLPRVAADPAAVAQVLSCLVRNGIDAILRGTTTRREIVVSAAWSDDGMVEVSVADSGPGIDPDASRTLFDPFAPDRPEDCGVGLAASRAIVEAFGGRIVVKSSDTRGAVVAFALPAARQGDVGERRGG
jgi:two-component system sensor kinase FixL